MRTIDYVNWVGNEIKGSKTFTLLNVTGVWINVCVLVLFFALALGIEETAISQITRNIDLFTIEVSTSKQASFTEQDFSQFEFDRRVLQVSPVLSSFGSLRIISDSSPQASETSFAEEDIYMESYFVKTKNQKADLRTTYLEFIQGRGLSQQTPSGILISKSLFKKLASKNDTLSDSNYQDRSFELVIKRGDGQLRAFPCNIVGIAEHTLFDSTLVYAAFPLAQTIDSWKNATNPSVSSTVEQKYNRFDLVTKDLSSLGSLRKDVEKRGYETRSVLDRIDNVRQVLFVSKLIFLFIVGISVLISAFNIVITLTSYVFKRQREIGILKSLGATDLQIQSIFVLHAIFLTFAGGLLGALTGLLLIQLIVFALSRVENFQSINLFRVSFSYVSGIVLSSIAIGILSAFVPAQKAASINPIETIRGN
jgi:ABC-type lipoprotein release transport system permease subunit